MHTALVRVKDSLLCSHVVIRGTGVRRALSEKLLLLQHTLENNRKVHNTDNDTTDPPSHDTKPQPGLFVLALGRFDLLKNAHFVFFFFCKMCPKLIFNIITDD